MVGWLDGWMVGWLDGWMVGWLDGWMFFLLLLRCLAVPPAISTKVPNSLPGLGSRVLSRWIFFGGQGYRGMFWTQKIR